MGPGEEIGFVAEVPHPNAGMVLKRGDYCCEQEALCIQSHLIMEHVAIPFIRYFTIANHITQPMRMGFGRQVTAQQPAWTPIRSAHVSGEEGQVDAESVFGGDICDG